MDRDRDRDRRFDDRWGGESYRPSHRSRRSRSRSRPRRTPPRSRSPRQTADSWAPTGTRRIQRIRSRSPTSPRRRSPSSSFRGRDRSRSRSPRKQYPVRRDERLRSPQGSSWRRSRSPPRQRSPPISRYVDNLPPRFHSHRSYNYVPGSPRRDQYYSTSSERASRYSPRRDRNSLAETDTRDSNRACQRISEKTGPFSESDRGPQDKRTSSPSKQQPIAGSSLNGSTSTSRRSSPSSYPLHPSRLSSRSPCRSPIDHSRVVRPEREPMRAHISASVTKQTAAPSPPGYTDKTASPGEPDLLRSESQRPSQSSGSESRSGTKTSPAPLGKLAPHSHQPINSSSINSFRDNRSSKESSPLASPSAGPSLSTGPQRGSNISLLSAPTRPKGGQVPQREGSWTSNQSLRWASGHSIHHGPPPGPRSSFAQHQTLHDGSRHTLYRPGVSSNHSAPRTPRARDYLVSVPTIVTGGKFLPSLLDPVIEKRLLQLEADGEKLFEQVLQKQNTKRLSLREWDKLEKETLANALRSDVAEEHLQKMAGPVSLIGSSSF